MLQGRALSRRQHWLRVLGNSTVGGNSRGQCWGLQALTGLSGVWVGCARLSGWVSTSGQDEADGVVVEQNQRTPAAVHHPTSARCGAGSSRGLWGWWCRCWEEGRVLWPCTHLSVLPLQWRRAAFPGQVSGTVSLGTALGPGTGIGGSCCSPGFINNQRNGVCGWEIPFPDGFGPGLGLPSSTSHPSTEECVWPAPCCALLPLPTLPGQAGGRIVVVGSQRSIPGNVRCSHASGAT